MDNLVGKGLLSPQWRQCLLEHRREHGDVVIACIRIDNDPSWQPFVQELSSEGVKVEYTVPYQQQQNGISGRGVRTITEHSRALLYELTFALIEQPGLTLDKWRFLWPEAVRFHAHVHNRTPRKIDGKMTTPYEVLYSKKPYVGNLQLLGAIAYVHVPPGTRAADVKPRSRLEKMAPRVLIS